MAEQEIQVQHKSGLRKLVGCIVTQCLATGVAVLVVLMAKDAVVIVVPAFFAATTANVGFLFGANVAEHKARLQSMVSAIAAKVAGQPEPEPEQPPQA